MAMTDIDRNKWWDQKVNQFGSGREAFRGSVYGQNIPNAIDMARRAGSMGAEGFIDQNDIKEAMRAGYFREANLYNYNPESFQLQGLRPEIAQQIGLEGIRSSQYAPQQAQLASFLANQAYGTGGPSVAELQLRQGMEQGQRGLLGAAANQRPGMGGGLARALARGYGQNVQNLAQQTAMLRAQEQLGAQGALASLLAQARGQDIQSQLGAGELALSAMKEEQAGKTLLEQQRAGDLFRLGSVVPQAMVSPPKGKRGIMSTIGQASGPVGNLFQGVGSIASGMGSLYGKGAK